jgi:hypothetical protein
MKHPLQRRMLAEDLVRLRRPDEHQRLASAQALGKIDANPHQLDAVAFALQRIPEGGCILADEVGLGKTIEAGLVMAQLLAEHATRVLLVVPKSLVGQWQTELLDLFGIAAHEVRRDPASLVGRGVFIAHRELAGGIRGAPLLTSCEPFDLIVIDEAHEIFAGIHKRYGRDGEYRSESTEARTAGRVLDVIHKHHAPVLLLTATPIQNSLAELWGLIHYVEPTDTLLGRLATFRSVFCKGNDQTLADGQETELRHRLNFVVQRTLRRQAQEFMKTPFVERQARLFEYTMGPEEKSLYEDLAVWLQSTTCAFRGPQRALLLIGFHRIMASSAAALRKSLERVAARLDKAIREPQALHALTDNLLVDLEETLPDRDDLADEYEALDDEEQAPDRSKPPTVAQLRSELERVNHFAARAQALPTDTKSQRLLDAIRLVSERARHGECRDKVVIFTESLTTQDYLCDHLVRSGLLVKDEITLFRGTNKGARAEAALTRWQSEVGDKLPVGKRPSHGVAMRLALIHEFRERSRVFISTEAGAKGLNLQFCSTLINYDLPWNPQRIEQRIGRVHRYGQQHGVLVINFLAQDNQAQALTLQILTQKLDLFGRVLDASDAVLHDTTSAPGELAASSLVVGFEASLRKIYEESRSLTEVETRLEHLRDTIEDQRASYERTQSRAASIIATRLDTQVKQVFTRYRDSISDELRAWGDRLFEFLSGYLEAAGIPFVADSDNPGIITILPSGSAPEPYHLGTRVTIPPAHGADAELLHLGHPLFIAAVDEARTATASHGGAWIRFIARGPIPAPLAHVAGRLGRIRVELIAYRGLEWSDHLLATAVVDGVEEPLHAEATASLWDLVIDDDPGAQTADTMRLDEHLMDAVNDARSLNIGAVGEHVRARFDRRTEQLERYVEDQITMLRAELAVAQRKQSEAESKGVTTSKPNANTSTIRRIEERLIALRARTDGDYQRWRDQLHDDRYAPPTVTVVIDVYFTLAGETC